MLDMIRGELFKLRKRNLTWILAVVLAAYFCLIFFATYGIVSNPPGRMPAEVIEHIKASLQFPKAANLIFHTANNIGIILLIILTASSIGSEYGWGSIRQILTRNGTRHNLVFSKLISLLIITFIGLVISVIVGFILTVITSALLNTIGWDFVTAAFLQEQLQNFGWTLYSLLPYILLTAFFAFLGRSAIAGIGGGLGFFFVEAIAVGIFNQAGGWLAKIPNYLIGPNVEAIIPESVFAQGPFSFNGEPLSALHSSITIAVYCIALVLISLWLFKKRDLTA